MSRQDEYLQSMLTDLGSVYYQTLQGEASEADVAKAAEAVRSHRASTQGAPSAGAVGAPAPMPRRGKWRVSDVMTRDVISIDKTMAYKQVARLLVERDLSAIPVVSGGGRVLGMVSEADVLRKSEMSFGRIGSGLRRRTHHERGQAEALSAAQLMSSPAVTIYPDAPLGAAARLMNGRRIRRLPVVNTAGELIGIVSRRDLLSVFLRPDAEISAEIADAVAGLAGPGTVAVTVNDGEATLTGSLPKADLIVAAVHAASEVDGVVAVFSELTVGQPAAHLS